MQNATGAFDEYSAVSKTDSTDPTKPSRVNNSYQYAVRHCIETVNRATGFHSTRHVFESKSTEANYPATAKI